MTRFLSQALQADEPFFRMSLQQLEAAHGSPNHDIRFSTEVLHETQDKLRQLGLDPRDTTDEELYHMLQERVRADDARLQRRLQTIAATHVSAEANVVSGMIHAIQALPDSKRCYGLKASVAKGLLRQQPPKKTMKLLGYRSFDSFLKHESPVLITAAARVVESAQWQKRFTAQYKRLQPADFEDRSIALLQPVGSKWEALAHEAVERRRHTLLSLKEFGVIVFLPLPKDAPDGSVTASLSLALHELNELRAASTFLKLSQVRADFGTVVQTIIAQEPQLQSRMLDKPVSWHLIQRYYAQLTHHDDEQVFEPHLDLADMSWHHVEDSLARIESSLNFWHKSAHLGMLNRSGAVSLNIVDAALNLCNNLPFERRVTQYFQQSLWHELLLRYLRHESVERSVLAELQPQLATEVVRA